MASDVETPFSESRKRGAGRSKIIRTGRVGRPKKQYHTANITTNEMNNDPQTRKEALGIPDREMWLDAMKTEYSSLQECNTWHIVERTPEMKVISSKWVFRIKRSQNEEINK